MSLICGVCAHCQPYKSEELLLFLPASFVTQEKIISYEDFQYEVLRVLRLSKDLLPLVVCHNPKNVSPERTLLFVVFRSTSVWFHINLSLLFLFGSL